jgi:hypothetical protein
MKLCVSKAGANEVCKSEFFGVSLFGAKLNMNKLESGKKAVEYLHKKLFVH